MIKSAHFLEMVSITPSSEIQALDVHRQHLKLQLELL
jgi:hypothetical protein